MKTYAVFTYPPRSVPAPKLTRGKPVRWTQPMPPEQPHPFRYVRDIRPGCGGYVVPVTKGATDV